MKLIILGTTIFGWAVVVGFTNILVQRSLDIQQDSSASQLTAGVIVGAGVMIGSLLINKLNSRLAKKTKPNDKAPNINLDHIAGSQ